MAQPPSYASLNLNLDLSVWRTRLLDERARLVRIEKSQESQSMEESRQGSESELARFSTFDPAENSDSASVLADTERSQVQIEEEKKLIGLIDHALERMDSGLYGVCEVTGKPIPIDRLKALPWATTTVEGAEIEERTG